MSTWSSAPKKILMDRSAAEVRDYPVGLIVNADLVVGIDKQIAKIRYGALGRATDDQIATCELLPLEEARRLVDEIYDQGEQTHQDPGKAEPVNELLGDSAGEEGRAHPFPNRVIIEVDRKAYPAALKAARFELMVVRSAVNYRVVEENHDVVRAMRLATVEEILSCEVLTPGWAHSLVLGRRVPEPAFEITDFVSPTSEAAVLTVGGLSEKSRGVVEERAFCPDCGRWHYRVVFGDLEARLHETSMVRAPRGLIASTYFDFSELDALQEAASVIERFADVDNGTWAELLLALHGSGWDLVKRGSRYVPAEETTPVAESAAVSMTNHAQEEAEATGIEVIPNMVERKIPGYRDDRVSYRYVPGRTVTEVSPDLPWAARRGGFRAAGATKEAAIAMIEQMEALAGGATGRETDDDGWQGTEPAADTRRALIRNTIIDLALEEASQIGNQVDPVWLARASLKMADGIESALLRATILAGEEEGDRNQDNGISKGCEVPGGPVVVQGDEGEAEED